MSREDRKRKLLAFLVDVGIALPRKVIHRNLAHRDQLTWSESSTKNYLRELAEEGELKRVEPEAFRDGRVEEASGRSVYYIATPQGQQRIEEYRAERDRYG